MPKKRKVNIRSIRKRILILCEGKETEPNYFNALIHDNEYKRFLSSVEITIYDTKKCTGKELVTEAKILKNNAKREKNQFDYIWIVIDKDGYSKLPETFDKAYANDMKIAFSSISFEYWFLLHFEYTTKCFKKADDLIKHLNRYLPNYKKSSNIYCKIKKNIKTAITNSNKVQKYYENDIERGKKIYTLNPYTNVNLLVEQLINLNQDE